MQIRQFNMSILSAFLLQSLFLSHLGAADNHRPPMVVAHRGLLLDRPENTLTNFRACLNLRLGFELDVRRSKDGQLVCVHDETVDRTTNGTGKVTALTLQELKSLDAGTWFSPSFKNERIPTLAEVFVELSKRTDAGVLIAVDVKGEDFDIERDIVRLANRHKVLDQLLMIGRTISDEDVRRRFRNADQKAHVACVANTPQEFAQALGNRLSDWVYVRYVPTREQVDKVHAAGKRVFIAGSTVSGLEPENWRRTAARGVDAILTDYSQHLARQSRSDQRRVSEIRAKLLHHFSPPTEYRNDFGKYRSPMLRSDGRRVQSPVEWKKQRDEISKEWHKLLGPWPPLLKAPRIKYLSSERRENFMQHEVQIEVHPGDQYAEGHLLVPDGKGPFPAVLVPFYESKTSIGLKKRGRDTHDYGLQLVRRGFVTLSIGTPGSIENPNQTTRELLTAAGERQRRQPLSFLAYVAANCHTALAQLPNVDETKIGIVGLSYGGKWSMFASCLYEKFACAVWSDPGIVFNESNSNVNYWEPWYLGYQHGTRRPAGVPNNERRRTGVYKQLFESGRDLNSLHALMCPRPVLVAGGTEDPLRNWQALNHLVAVNKLLGSDNRVAMTQRKTHVPTPEALEKTLMFLEYFLKFQ